MGCHSVLLSGTVYTQVGRTINLSMAEKMLWEYAAPFQITVTWKRCRERRRSSNSLVDKLTHPVRQLESGRYC
jgi:hypothetical protein